MILTTAQYLPTSLNTLSSFVAFIINSGYPTMLYMASAYRKITTGKNGKRGIFTPGGSALSLCLFSAVEGKQLPQGQTTESRFLTFSFAALFVSGSIQVTYFKLSSKAHLMSETISSACTTRKELNSKRLHVTKL